MRIRTKMMITTGAVALAGAGALGGVGLASAATGSDGTNLASAIATKFGLKEADVQAVIDTKRTEQQAARQAKVEEKLTQAVTDGKITAAQKTAILAKMKELQAARTSNKDSMKDITADERKAAMDKERTALETWAKDNGLTTDQLRQYVMMGGHGGMGMGGMRGDQPADSGSDSSSSTN